MFSRPLLKATIRQNYLVFVVIIAVLMLYLPIIIGMYDPVTQKSLNDMLEMMPAALISALGFSGASASLIGFVSTYYYGFLIFLVPMIYTIVVCNRSIVSHVDKGSMAYILSTPNTRQRIIRTQAMFILASVTLMIGIVTLAGIAISEIQFPGQMDIRGFFMINLGVLLLYYALTGIGFFASSLFNDTKNSLGIGAGLPVAFLLFNMISNVGEATRFFRYISLFTLFDTDQIISGEGFLLSFIVLGIIAAVMYGMAFYVFSRRDLPL